MANEQIPIHVDCTWAEYREIVEQGLLEEDKIYFITDKNNGGRLVAELIHEIQELRRELDNLQR